MQWIRSCCHCRGHRFDSWSRKISHASEQLSQCSTSTEPTCSNYWSPSTQSLCFATGEATTMRSPHTAVKGRPHPSQPEKACVQQQRPSTAKDKLNELLVCLTQWKIPMKHFWHTQYNSYLKEKDFWYSLSHKLSWPFSHGTPFLPERIPARQTCYLHMGIWELFLFFSNISQVSLSLQGNNW